VTPKQRLFITEYLIDLNATKAAERAGYRPGYARHASYDLLRKPAIAAAVAEGMAARARRTEIDADRVLRELAKLAFADMRRLATWDENGVKLRKHTEIAEEDAAAIAQVSRGGARIKLHDTRKALDSIARHLGMFGKGNKNDVPYGADIRTPALERARAALKARIAQIIAERDGTEDGTDNK
jgi:phage terminase small subunit